MYVGTGLRPGYRPSNSLPHVRWAAEANVVGPEDGAAWRIASTFHATVEEPLLRGVHNHEVRDCGDGPVGPQAPEGYYHAHADPGVLASQVNASTHPTEASGTRLRGLLLLLGGRDCQSRKAEVSRGAASRSAVAAGSDIALFALSHH